MRARWALLLDRATSFFPPTYDASAHKATSCGINS
jgi:hypothetical protein